MTLMRQDPRIATWIVTALVLAGCGGDAPRVSGDAADVTLTVDLGPTDAPSNDASPPPMDAPRDIAGDTAPDRSFPDVQAAETGVRDVTDAAPLDSGPLDSGPLDSGPLDSGPLDSGPLDSGPLDASPLDVPRDAPRPDAPPSDTVVVDVPDALSADVSDSAPADVSVVPALPLLVEAEDATLTGGLTPVVSGPTSVRGTVVMPTAGSASLQVRFRVERPGAVFVWARVRAPSHNNDSLFALVDGEATRDAAVWDIPVTPVLRWLRVARRGATGTFWRANDTSFAGAFTPGVHTLDLAAREVGVEVDAVLITQSTAEPEERFLQAPVHTTTRSVRDFGARGDGTTDDTAALRMALAALRSGDVLRFPAGRYRFTGPLTLTTSGVTLTGDGPTSVLFADLPLASVGASLSIAGRADTERVALAADAPFLSRELAVAATATFAAGDALVVTSDEWGPAAPNLTTLFFRNRANMVRVTAVRTEPGRRVLSLDRPLLGPFLMANNAAAYRFNPVRDVVVRALAMEGTRGATPEANPDTSLIGCLRCDRVFFEDLELRYSRVSGLDLARSLDCSARRVHVSDVTDTGGGGHGYGVTVTRSQGVVVRECLFDGVIRHGVPVSWGARETFVFRNRFIRTVAHADRIASIDIHGQDDYCNLVEGNYIRGGRPGIIVGGGGTTHGNDGPWNVIRNNVIEDADEGIAVYKETYDTIIEGNQITRSLEEAIRVESGSDHTVIWRNVIDAWRTFGVDMADADRGDLRGNVFRGASLPAVRVQRGRDYVIRDNTLNGATLVHPGVGDVGDNR